MIVVVGSRHDRDALALVTCWPEARLLSAEDLTSAGWEWAVCDGPRIWVVDGERIDDRHVSGVFVRRSTVHPEELVGVHRDDRSYLAAECHAFLIAVLGTTHAKVVNPVGEGAMGDEALRPERWMPAAVAAGLVPRPILLSDATQPVLPTPAHMVEVAGGQPFASSPEVPEQIRAGAVEMIATLDMTWGCCAFDEQRRLIGVTTSFQPSAGARVELGRLLAGGGP